VLIAGESRERLAKMPHKKQQREKEWRSTHEALETRGRRE
jgi:hypothetical protein